jgi:hypothetical protein
MSARTNLSLIAAVGVELSLLLILLHVPPAARLLGHTGPTTIGFAVAAAAIPAFVLVDSGYKRLLRADASEAGVVHRQRSDDHRP